MFPVFPEFLPLSMELKEPYNALVEALPPYSDISFTTLQIWWNLSEKLSVSMLNRNLIINYEIPSSPAASGLSLVGKHKIDESMRIIFHHLRAKQQPVRLVHVPEFVIQAMQDPAQFTIDEEPDYNEYVLDSAALSKLEGHAYQLLRKKIKRFVREVGERKLEVKALDLSLTEVQDQIFASIAEWGEQRVSKNDPEHSEHDALKKSLQHASALGLRSLSLHINDELHGILIYHRPLGKEYYVLHHLKVNYGTPYISDYMHHQMAKTALDDNVTKLNIEMDLGIENLRKHKLTLRPTEFLRKYTVTPA